MLSQAERMGRFENKAQGPDAPPPRGKFDLAGFPVKLIFLADLNRVKIKECPPKDETRTDETGELATSPKKTGPSSCTYISEIDFFSPHLIQGNGIETPHIGA